MRSVWILVALLFAAPTAQAFSSVETGHSPHDKITAVAEDLGWPEGAVEALQEGVRQADIADFDEVKVDGEKRTVVTPNFHPWHHCDRVAPATDGQALNETIAYIAWERDLAGNLSLLDPPAAMRALGRALHALQDCYSHSNAVDLEPLAQGRLQAALLDGGTMPAGLILCGSQPSAAEIGRPPGDPYPHDDRNKDDAHSTPESEVLLPDGRTKHEAARDLAADATVAFLSAFMAGLDADESAALLAVEPAKHDGKNSKGLSIPAAPSLTILFAIFLAGLVTRLRR